MTTMTAMTAMTINSTAPTVISETAVAESRPKLDTEQTLRKKLEPMFRMRDAAAVGGQKQSASAVAEAGGAVSDGNPSCGTSQAGAVINYARGNRSRGTSRAA